MNFATVRGYLPGILLAGVVAGTARLLDGAGFGPALIYALVLGMLLRTVADGSAPKSGVDFSSKHLLAVAVALLGARLTLADISAIGLTPAIVVLVAIVATILFSLFLARMLGLSSNLGFLAGIGTAHCGASAAIATAAVLPKDKDLERDTALIIVGVVSLSAIAMVLYPLLSVMLGLNDVEAGIFLGGSIHNVPQAVAAGMTFSEEAGDVATLTKLFRVALIGPAVMAVAIFIGSSKGASITSLRLPWFVIAFALLIVIGSLGLLPPQLKNAFSFVSGWLMLIAVAAIGMKTSLEAMRTVGARVLVLLVLNTLLLAAVLLGAVLLGIF